MVCEMLLEFMQINIKDGLFNTTNTSSIDDEFNSCLKI